MLLKTFAIAKNVEVLSFVVRIDDEAIQGRIFVESSLKSLKTVLRHNGNVYLSNPLTYLLQMKEYYENVKQLLIAIKYAQYMGCVWYVYVPYTSGTTWSTRSDDFG